MKQVVITGKDSYIGNHISDWLKTYSDKYAVRQLDVTDDKWKNFDFSGTHTVVHVAGIVHRKDCNDWALFKRVNCDLTVEIAAKAKSQGVKQFLFLSTMAIYGKEKELRENIIDSETLPAPQSFYGKSKFLAEQELGKLADENFCVSIVRPPNVYGNMCKGGYISGFASVVKKLPIIPAAFTKVRQSMIYIDNLTELTRLMIDFPKTETVMPQDDKPVAAVELMRTMGAAMKCNTRTSKLLGVCVRMLAFLPLVKKAYGGVEYDVDVSKVFDNRYQVVDFKTAIERTLSVRAFQDGDVRRR